MATPVDEPPHAGEQAAVETDAQRAFREAGRARAQEIGADQREAREAIVAALARLRDKGYSRQFVRGVASHSAQWVPCISIEWPPQNARSAADDA